MTVMLLANSVKFRTATIVTNVFRRVAGGYSIWSTASGWWRRGNLDNGRTEASAAQLSSDSLQDRCTHHPSASGAQASRNTPPVRRGCARAAPVLLQRPRFFFQRSFSFTTSGLCQRTTTVSACEAAICQMEDSVRIRRQGRPTAGLRRRISCVSF